MRLRRRENEEGHTVGQSGTDDTSESQWIVLSRTYYMRVTVVFLTFSVVLSILRGRGRG
jgi:hypothetical protein